MCTIALLRHVHPELPLVVAANRDEFYARAADPPMALAAEPLVVGGRDRERGGTWLGATAGGLFAAVTNQRTLQAPDPARRSRGELMLAVLRSGSPAAARRLLEAAHPGDYNPFNLVFGDHEQLHVAYGRDDAGALELEEVPDGVHVLSNDRLDSTALIKVGRMRALAAAAPAGAPFDALWPALAAALADHALPPLDEVPAPRPGGRLSHELLHALQAICIHSPHYGTRSAAIVAFPAAGPPRYLHADGPPCTTPFLDAGHLFARGAA